MDVLVVGGSAVVPGAVLRSRPVGVLFMEDEAGVDEKILAVPVDKLLPYYTQIDTYEQLPEILRNQIAHFFTHYKDLERGKWAKIGGWGGPADAAETIRQSISRAEQDEDKAAREVKA
jgi:inorganic pyrophosphatase